MLGYFRKLDILNRLFILKYGDLSDLENAAILKLPRITGFDYFGAIDLDYSDKRLLLCIFTKKRIYYLLSLVLIEIIISTKNVLLDSKILFKLQNYYSKKKFKSIVHANKLELLERDWLVRALKIKDIEFVLNCMLVSINLELAKNNQFFRDRGLVGANDVEQELVLKFNSENLLDKALLKLLNLYPSITNY